jgi:uncharacterized DUF497 family protein
MTASFLLGSLSSMNDDPGSAGRQIDGPAGGAHRRNVRDGGEAFPRGLRLEDQRGQRPRSLEALPARRAGIAERDAPPLGQENKTDDNVLTKGMHSYILYLTIMKHIRWDENKNEWLQRERGVCFEQIVVLFEHGNVLEIVDNPNQTKYPKQKIAIVEIDGYVFLVPYEQHGNEIELKTTIPSRKATKQYLGDNP